MVEHLKVLSLTVEPAFASLSVEHLKVLMVEHLKVMAASRACLRIQFTYLVGGAMVERLRTLTVEPAFAFN